jgi:hypothetical protein
MIMNLLGVKQPAHSEPVAHDTTKTGSREQGTGNREQGTGNREQEQEQEQEQE